MRAFIFSLDAFVAFTLALVAIYSLIFFSSVPSAYYYLLTQGHYLSRDILLSLSTTRCSDDYGVCENGLGSVLDNMVSMGDPNETSNREQLIKNTVGVMVPRQFGYAVELSGTEGSSWELVYDTKDDAMDDHAKTRKKLTVSTQVITFGYSGRVNKFVESPFNYLTCNGDGYNLDGSIGSGTGGGTGTSGTSGGGDAGIITCGSVSNNGTGGPGSVSSNGSGTEGTPFGNIHPSNVLGGDLVPSSDVRLVRLTIYI
ncbi:MAG TPA: hypothetical protein VLD37_05535 [Candidatus Bilamarchaeum sp.]|nr:hypothetical protein [Candidatus Bilamarchaeum sp.]